MSIFASILVIAAVCGGAVATYLYDEGAHPAARVAAGVPTGLAALGLVGFVISSFIGLNGFSLALSGLATAAPLALLARADLRANARRDARLLARDLREAITRPSLRATAPLVLVACSLVLFWLVYERAMFERGGAIYTGVDNNLGDLPFHLSIITSFVRGENFPPVHPEYAGARLTYPFVVDFVAAMFARAGATYEGALFWENLLLAVSLVGLLYRFALAWTGDRLAALLAPVLTIFSGGLGFVNFFRDALASPRGFAHFLFHPPHDYTITFDGAYRWGNAVTTLLVPQRGLLLGLPLALVVVTQWWLASRGEGDAGTRGGADAATDEEARGKKGKKGRAKTARARQTETPPYEPFKSLPFFSTLHCAERRMLGAGVVAGLLPLVHAHSFVVLMLVAGCLALLLPRWRAWIVFFAAAFVLAAPAMWWATRGTAARPSSFFAWQFGWDSERQKVESPWLEQLLGYAPAIKPYVVRAVSVLWFWIRNTGLFIPLLVAALALRGRAPAASKRLLLFYLPFTLLFVICNAAKISPWVWDNIKVLFYWYVASVPLVALLLARLWRRGAALKLMTAALIVALTLAGALDVWRVVAGATEQGEFDRDGVAFAEMIARETAPRSLILHAPTYNHPVYLSGRQSLMGYAGHLWSQGVDYDARESEVSRVYAGASDAEQLLAKYGVEYVVVSPLERAGLRVDEQFFTRFKKVGETGAYQLYKVARQ